VGRQTGGHQRHWGEGYPAPGIFENPPGKYSVKAKPKGPLWPAQCPGRCVGVGRGRLRRRPRHRGSAARTPAGPRRRSPETQNLRLNPNSATTLRVSFSATEDLKEIMGKRA